VLDSGQLEAAGQIVRKLITKGVSIIHARLLEIGYRFKSREAVFSEIYYANAFGGTESISGPGSSLEQTEAIRQEIPKIIEELNVKSLLDAACGDFHWMKEMNLHIDKYIGVDIVPDLIESNREKYSSDGKEFVILDIVKSCLPSVDLILCRDCLIHLSFKDIFSTVENFCRSNSKYLFTTTFIKQLNNVDIKTGRVRPINLSLPPLNFREPLRIINEQCTEQNRKYSDKCLLT
jgi:Methyltransferase domain